MQATIAVHGKLSEIPQWMGHLCPFGILQTVTSAPLEDIDLVARFQRGDRSAFSTLFERHHGSVSRLIARMMGEPRRMRSAVVEMEDLVQDVFVQVYRSLGGFRGGSKVSTWIYRIAVNVVLMHRRSARSRPMFYAADELDVPESPERVPDEEVSRQLNVAALYRLLAQVSDKKRTAYILHEIEGLSPSEIAEIVGAPVLTVRTRLFYARRELSALLRSDPHLSVVLEEVEAEARRVARQNGGPSIADPKGPKGNPRRDEGRDEGRIGPDESERDCAANSSGQPSVARVRHLREVPSSPSEPRTSRTGNGKAGPS